jgi:hypothetical protein
MDIATHCIGSIDSKSAITNMALVRNFEIIPVVSGLYLLHVLTSAGPCIVVYFYSKTNQMHNISNVFYFGTTLCMFRTVSPSMIRSLRLYIPV